MYRESHYHSTTHECLGVFRGHAKLRFGVSNDDNPDDAVVLDVKSGDVIVIPAGVAHCALNESGEFSMVGAYPEVPHTTLSLSRFVIPFPFSTSRGAYNPACVLTPVCPYFCALPVLPLSAGCPCFWCLKVAGGSADDRVPRSGICAMAARMPEPMPPKSPRSISPKTTPSKAKTAL